MSKPPHSQRGPKQGLPSNQSAPQQTTTTTTIVKSSGWSGPLPPPEALERFNAIIPNGADRIVSMAEREQAHRIDLEGSGQKATIAEARRGQYLGAIISAIALGGAVYTAHIGAHWSVWS